MPTSTADTRTVARALSHPLRVRILEVLNERDMSPSEFLSRGFANGLMAKSGGLSQVSYHFRALHDAACLEVVDLVPVRGAMEHVYRGTARAIHHDDEWEELPRARREAISRVTLLGLMARAESSLLDGTFDDRTDRHLTWIAMDLDEEGWDALHGLQNETWERAEEIRREAQARIEDRGSKSAATIPVTFGALGFQSQPTPGTHEHGRQHVDPRDAEPDR
jgi:DNA-binding transcriptional ArsR family regulator